MYVKKSLRRRHNLHLHDARFLRANRLAAGPENRMVS